MQSCTAKCAEGRVGFLGGFFGLFSLSFSFFFAMATVKHADAAASSSFKLATFLFLSCNIFYFIAQTCIMTEIH